MEGLERRYTTAEVAKMYQCSPITVARWVRTGRLTAINLGGNRNGPYVFRQEDIDAFEQKSRVSKGES